MNLETVDIGELLGRLSALEDTCYADLATLRPSLRVMTLMRATPSSDEDLQAAAEEIIAETKPCGRNDPRKVGAELPMCFLLLLSGKRSPGLVRAVVKRWVLHLDEQCGHGLGVHSAVMMVTCWVSAYILQRQGHPEDVVFLEGVAGAEEVEKEDPFAVACLVRAAQVVRFSGLARVANSAAFAESPN